jgi:hypothetical protein
MNFKLIAVFVALTLGGCGKPPEPEKAPVSVAIKNSSQFEIQHVFVHSDDESYRDVESLISTPLAMGGTVSYTTTLSRLRVTVTRVKYEDGPLRAYTTQPTIEVDEPLTVEYLDSQFRVSKQSEGGF